MEISKALYETKPCGVMLTIHAKSNEQQETRIVINKKFGGQLKAGAWFAKRETSIRHCMKELEDVCMD